MTSGQENFDRNGQYAKRGKIDMTVIGPLMENDYFKKAPPKSTGRELFNEKFLREHLGPLLASNPIDAIATLMYYTCLTIQESYRAHVFGKYSISDIVVSGGGVHNKTLMKKLECLFAPIPVVSIESLGLPSQAKEPLAFAFFGLRCLHNQPNHLPTGTGAKRSVILGRITRS
jgi:anhydro-N-acetylmuramic acid kinase